MPLTWTQAELDALGEAIKLGALEVEYQGPNGTKKVTYRSQGQMIALFEQGQRALGATSSSDTGLRYLTHDRGTNR